MGNKHELHCNKTKSHMVKFFVCLFICVVFLQTADSYSNELTFLAHPTPIEYLLVQVCTFYFFGVFLFLDCFPLFGLLLNE